MYEPHNTTVKTTATCIKDVYLCLQLPLQLSWAWSNILGSTAVARQ